MRVNIFIFYKTNHLHVFPTMEIMKDPLPTYNRPGRKPIFRRDRHLQSALHNTEISYKFRDWNNPAGLKKKHIQLKKDTVGAYYLPSDQFIHWALLHVSKKPHARRKASFQTINSSP